MRKAFKHLRTFLSMDATHTRSKYRMVLAITVGIDANGETILLCWGLMPGEDKDYWRWYCHMMTLAFPALADEEIAKYFVLMSDRQRGIINAVEEELLYIVPAHCCQHIADNIYVRYIFITISRETEC